MLVIEIIMLVAGIASYVYGNQMNNSIEMQVKSLLNSGTTNPGSIFVTVGIVVVVVGVILIVIGCIKKFKGNTGNGQVPQRTLKELQSTHSIRRYFTYCGCSIIRLRQANEQQY